jgi:nucleoside-diphosphate-sugar epimerase
MMVSKTAFLVGGTGVIGRAAARRLAGTGWRVTVAARNAPRREQLPGRVSFVGLDRNRSDQVTDALADGTDVLVYLPGYTGRDAELMLSLQHRVGSIIAISSAVVYVDERGRGQGEPAGDDAFAVLPVPVNEEQPTASPGGPGYAGAKMAMERILFNGAKVPVTVFRPCNVHAPGARRPMEWYFLKRALDQRPVFIYGYRGHSVLHPVSAENIAELIRLAAERPGHGVFNAGDDDPPDVRRIGHLVASTVGHDPLDLLLPGAPPSPRVGASPWSVPHPVVLDMRKARHELGYAPMTSYNRTITQVCAWLRDETANRDWREVFPSLSGDQFDYAAEDAYLHSMEETGRNGPPWPAAG